MKVASYNVKFKEKKYRGMRDKEREMKEEMK